MAETAVSAVREVLFADPRSQAYAVLDGASVPGLPDRLYRHDPEHECLLRGTLPPDLAQVAPYLVRLEKESRFCEWILHEGWGRHWGIFAISRADLRAMRQHFRRFLRVHDSQGEPLHFRYYDPRILNQYLPIATAGQLEIMFQQVRAYYAEAEPASHLWKYQLMQGALAATKMTVGPEGGRI